MSYPFSDAYSVCQACFEENPANYQLPEERFCRRHPDGGRVNVYWDDVNYQFFYKIRPMPNKEISGRFVLCHFGSQCKGERCTFAHTRAEQDEWNKQRFSSKHKVGRVSSEPVRKKSASSAPPAKQKFPMRHKTSMPEMFPMRQQTSVPEMFPKSEQPSFHSKMPNHGSMSAMLNEKNYIKWFSDLIALEQKSHANILRERCDGTFQLVVEERVPGYSQRCMYLLGISGDNIAYVTQASDHVILANKRGSIQGAILSENFFHTDEVLYVDVDERDLSRSFNLPTKECRWHVNVQFALKVSYFDSLQRFVCSLTPPIIKRLLSSEFPPFQLASLENMYNVLHLQTCSEDQQHALATIVASPVGSPPVLVTGPFGTGKTRILALAAHYFLQCSMREEKVTSILVCTQQHVSADAFLDCLKGLVISIPSSTYVARIDNRNAKKAGSPLHKHQRRLDDFQLDYKHNPPTRKRPYLIVTTSQTAHGLRRRLPRDFYFTHILLDEVAQMREAEAVAPLCMANMATKIVLAGDKQQVGPDLLVLGEQSREKGFSRSLLKRLEERYTKSGKNALSYIVRLVTNYRCHPEILSLAEKLFYSDSLKSVVPPKSTHPDAPFPLVFVCSDLKEPKPSENPVNESEAAIVIEQLQRFAPGWPQDNWGAKLDPKQICLMSPSRTQVNKFKELLFKKTTEVPEMLKQVEKHPSYDMQGREYRVLFLSTFEATNEDGSTRNPTKSIADPFVVNTVVTRARSLVVCIGNPYQLLNMEKHMCIKYGEKGKYWSNYLRRCIDNQSMEFHSSTKVLDANKQVELNRLNRAVEQCIAVKYDLDESTGTYSSENTPKRHIGDGDLETEECEVPEKYTGRLEMDFNVGKMLGKGGFATVFEVKSKIDGGSYALKIVKLPNKKNSHKKILREVRGLRKLDQPNSHPNIVRYYSSWIDVAPTDRRQNMAPWKDIECGKEIPLSDSDSGTGVFSRGETTAETETVTSANYSSDSAAVIKYKTEHDETTSTTTSTATTEIASSASLVVPCLLIRTELCDKTLKQWLEEHKKRKRKRLFLYFEQILNAIRYVHHNKLAHRDLKPSNIFRSLENKDVLKVGDFGLVAGNFGSPDLSSQSRARHEVSFSGQAGTPLYMAPEQLERTRCTEKVDIYALGVIYFEMNYVFSSLHEKHKVLKDLQKKDFGVPHKFAKLLPKETTVIQKMMSHDPDHRPTADHILESQWFNELRKSVEEQPVYVPKM